MFYILAHTIAFNEYVLEYHFIPHLDILDEVTYYLKKFTIIVGIPMMIVGHFFRISAMFTAAKNFHHIVQLMIPSTYNNAIITENNS
jgi:hypothetical protein